MTPHRIEPLGREDGFQDLETALAPLSDLVRHRIRIPAEAPDRRSWPKELAPAVPRRAAELGIEAPWRPQAESIGPLLQGEHVVLAAPTASGKSLVYLTVALHHLLQDPSARVLYVAPTKALARDQLVAARSWVEGLLPRTTVAALDGDTPSSERRALRERARLVFTNPEMLHRSILPHHPAWSAWLGRLRLLVLDEVHAMRGVFGAHVAWVLRRLERLRRRYAPPGAPPAAVFLASATIGNPGAHAERLVGAPVAHVGGQGAPVPGRLLALGTPGWEERELGVRRSLGDETVRVTHALRGAGLRTLVFTRSRRGAEELVRALRQQAPADAEGVRVYRAGLRSAQRRAVEQGLRDGTLDVVVSTSALELGVDPGPLDACVLSGYPGTLASFWQQAGRAGRRERPALVVWLAGTSALEQYLLRHPDRLLDGQVEHACSDPENPLVQLAHLRCAAYEQPLEAGDAAAPLREALVRRREVREAGGRWHWIGPEQPAAEVSLRRVSAAEVQVRLGDDSGASGPRLDQVPLEDAAARLHPGALYLHDGRTYRVVALDLERREARLMPATDEEEDHITVPRGDTEVDFHTVREAREAPGASLRHGLLGVTHRVTGYRELVRDTGEVLVEADLRLPPTRLETAGMQVTLAADVIRALQEAGWWRSAPRSGSRGPGWAAQRARARARDGYCCRHCGVAEPDARQHDVHHLRPFRTFGWAPGINTAHREANRLENLITLCPACHRRAETAQQTLGLLQRAAHVLHGLAPMTLMCDPRDLAFHVEEPDAQGAGAGWLVTERTPGGVGFGEALFGEHERWMDRALATVTGCDCRQGCPACVGPPDPHLPEARRACATLFELLGARRGEAAP